MSAIQSQLADMTKEQLIERIQKMERLCQLSAIDATEQAEKVAELETSLQSTENYWKSKCENAEAELEGFRSICNEYLSGPDAPYTELRSWCDEAGDYQYDLQSLQNDLEELDTLMDDLPGVSEYGHLVDYIKELQKSPINQRLVEAGMSPLSSEEAGDILKRIGQ
jgi:hypothetical protein